MISDKIKKVSFILITIYIIFADVENFSSETQNQIIQWAKRQNKKPIKNSNLLLIIEWNEQDLTHRVNQNGAHSKDALVASIVDFFDFILLILTFILLTNNLIFLLDIHLISGCGQVPTTGRPLNSIFSFTPTGSYQLMADVITILNCNRNW